MDEKTKVDTILEKLKSHKIVSYIFLIAIMIIGIGTLTDAIDKTILFAQKYIYTQDSELPQSQNVYTQDITLNSYQIQDIQNKYRVTITFKHSKNEPLGFIAFIAIIEDNSNATILKFWPSDGQNFVHKDTSQKILNNGKRAELFFQPLVVGMISLDIDISEKTKIFIEGSHNLKPFSVEILK